LKDNTGNADPLCCTTGMIRQLQTENYRIRINASSGNKALVVGDPNLNGYKLARQLPGAYNEAIEVENMLGINGFDMPNNCIFKSASEIVQAIFKDEYRIIHLAGHGMFNEKDPELSGMLIGNGIFLTTKEICQMSKVPDLVFVNCCYLGKVGETAEEISNQRYKLAANIGTQLIMNGVKVVIAAGWAVDDEAALHFTKAFYKEILSDNEFGKAITTARKSTYNNYGHNNTWGAYQCYGDPYFKLTNIIRSATSKAAFTIGARSDKPIPNQTSQPTKPKYSFLIAQEAEVKLFNIISKADTKGYSVKYIEDELNNIELAINAAGIRNASLTEKEAIAYTECNNYEKAVEKFETLLGMEYAGFTVKALEKYCNVRAKLCIKKWQADPKNKNNIASQLKGINKVIEDLKRLNEMSVTGERYSLLGSAYKRKAMILAVRNDIINALVRSVDYYYKAKEIPENLSKTKAEINWLVIENILVLTGKHKWPPAQKKTGKMPSLKMAKETMDLMISGKAEIENNQGADMDFWYEISMANAILCRWLLEGKNTADISDKQVVEAYSKVWNLAGSQNKKMAEIEHLDFLIDVYTNLVKKSGIAGTLKKIRQKLESIIR
jgi:hypothetical protein